MHASKSLIAYATELNRDRVAPNISSLEETGLVAFDRDDESMYVFIHFISFINEPL